MIATVCKSCNTITRAIVDRCYYCGSRMTEVKNVDPLYVKPLAKGRDILTEFEHVDKEPKGLIQ